MLREYFMRMLILLLKVAAVVLLVATAWKVHGTQWHATYAAMALLVAIVLALLDRLEERGE